MEVTTKWTCDRCFRSIERVEDGWVQWLSTGGYPNVRAERLQLVHHKSASPLTNSDDGCYFNQQSMREGFGYLVEDLPLASFVGQAGLMRLFDLLEEGELPQKEVLELAKRLHVPGYEKLRSGR